MTQSARRSAPSASLWMGRGNGYGRVLLSCHFHCVGEPREDLLLLCHLDSVCIDIVDGLHVAEKDALGSPVTVITFYGHPFLDVEGGMSEGARNDTRLTPDTLVLVDEDSLIFDITMAGLCGADLRAEGFLAILAAHRKIESYVFPFHHFNTGAAGVARSGMIDRADHLALPAPRTFLMIYDQYLPVHGFLLLPPQSA